MLDTSKMTNTDLKAAINLANLNIQSVVPSARRMLEARIMTMQQELLRRTGKA